MEVSHLAQGSCHVLTRSNDSFGTILLPSFHSTNTTTQQTTSTHMASASLSIPIAFWSQSTPTANISATLACEGYVVAGLEEGLIWVFKATCGPTDAFFVAGPPKDIVSVTSPTFLRFDRVPSTIEHTWSKNKRFDLALLLHFLSSHS